MHLELRLKSNICLGKFMLSPFLSAKGDVWENQGLQACDRVTNKQGGAAPVHFLCVHVSRCPTQTADQLVLGRGFRCILGTPLGISLAPHAEQKGG